MSEEKLPLEKLKEQYIPVVDFPEKYGISVLKVMRLIDEHKIRYAEFRAPGESRRTPHANPADVLEAIRREKK